MVDETDDGEAETALHGLPAFRVDGATGTAYFEAGGDPHACASFVRSLSSSAPSHPMAIVLRDLKYHKVTKWMEENCVSAMLTTKEICKGAINVDLDDPELTPKERQNIRTMLSNFIRDFDRELKARARNPLKVISRVLDGASNEKSHKIVPKPYVEAPEA